MKVIWQTSAKKGKSEPQTQAQQINNEINSNQ